MPTYKHEAYGTAVTVGWTTNPMTSLATLNHTGPSDPQDNGTALALLADCELQVKFAAAPAVGAYLTLFLLASADGANYPDGASGTATPPASTLAVATFECRAVATAQRVVVRDVILPPGLWKAIIYNGGTTALSSLATDHVLRFRPHNLSVT